MAELIKLKTWIEFRLTETGFNTEKIKAYREILKKVDTMITDCE